MKQIERRFSADDGTRLFGRVWLPDEDPRAWLIIVHGLAEHGGRYHHLANHVAAHGVAAAAVDLRGHGKSSGRRGYASRFDDYVTDVERLLRHTMNDRGDRPTFLLGHSVGGAVAAHAALRNRERLAGLILSSPLLKVSDQISPFLQRMSGLLGTFLPTLRTVQVDAEAISRDPEVVAGYRADPLNDRGGTRARTGREIMRASHYLRKHGQEIDLPVLVFHGTGDRIADVEGSLLFYETSSSTDKTLKVYRGLYHETLNEPEQRMVLEDVMEWLDEHLGVLA